MSRMSDLALEVDELVVQAIEYGAQTQQQVQNYVNDRLGVYIDIGQINRIIDDFYGHYGLLPPSPLSLD